MAASETNLEPSQPRPPLSRWLLGTLLILLSWLILGSVLTALSASFLSLDIVALTGSDETSRAILDTYSPWKSAAAILISWIPLALSTILLYRYLLRERIRSLFTRSKRSFAREVRIGAAAMTLILILTALPDLLLNSSEYSFTFELSRFLPYLLVAFSLIPIQTTAEELFFRGWIQQRLEKPGRSIWLVSSIGGLIFAAPHLGNPEVNGELLLALLGYGATGFMLSWVTMRDRSIGIAVGAHAANNILAGLLITSADSALPSASIWTVPEVAWLSAAIVSILIVPIFIWLTGRWNREVA